LLSGGLVRIRTRGPTSKANAPADFASSPARLLTLAPSTPRSYSIAEERGSRSICSWCSASSTSRGVDRSWLGYLTAEPSLAGAPRPNVSSVAFRGTSGWFPDWSTRSQCRVSDHVRKAASAAASFGLPTGGRAPRPSQSARARPASTLRAAAGSPASAVNSVDEIERSWKSSEAN
jgi:hypothetical protein